MGQDSITRYIKCQVCPWTLVSFLPTFLGGPLLRKPSQRVHDTPLKCKPWAGHNRTSRPFFFFLCLMYDMQFLTMWQRKAEHRRHQGRSPHPKYPNTIGVEEEGPAGAPTPILWFFNWKNSVVERGEVVLSTSLTFESWLGIKLKH